MHITGMTMGWIPPFTKPVECKFDERVNLFIGPNSSGKSTALRLLRECRREDREYFSYYHIPISFAKASVSDDWPKVMEDSHEPVPRWNELPYAEIAATRIGLPHVEPDYLDSLDLPSMPEDRTIAEILGPRNSLEIFDGKYVERAVHLLVEKTRSTDRPSERVNLAKARDISFLCAKNICCEIVEGSAPLNIVMGGGDLHDDLFATLPEVRVAMGIDTIDCDPQGDSLPMHWLSSGVQDSLLWIRFLALKILCHYDFADGWEKKPAILLIDEIENHLHPTWQRRIIPALLEHFPGLQIFATTHSPFVVAGLKAGQVHLLNRDANGVVTATTNTEDIVGWTADEILRTMMGVQDPTDDETARNAAELRRLRDEGPRADEREEAERQKRMQELRRLVDRDLLAGGPKARRREDFARRFREAMEHQRQEEELNQDNG